MSNKLKSFVEIVFIISLFVVFSYLIQANIDFFASLLDNQFGIFVYVFVTIIGIVIAPVSSLPLIIIAAKLWGVFAAGLLSIIGWTIGSMIAFLIARRYGVSLIKKFIPLNSINKLEQRIPKENVFWGVVFLRMIIPVDILSYALGLFSKINFKKFTLATLIGVSPFAFVWASLGVVPWIFQVAALIISLIILLVGYLIKARIRKKKKIK